MNTKKLEKKLIKSSVACSNCGKDAEPLKPFMRCGKCRFPSYCSKECQKIHWKEHKKVCQPSIEQKQHVVEIFGKDWSKFADDWRKRMADALFFLAKSEVGEDRRLDHALWNDCEYVTSENGSPRMVVTSFRAVPFALLQMQYGLGIIEQMVAMRGTVPPAQNVNYHIMNCIRDVQRPHLDPLMKVSYIGIGTVTSPVTLTRTSQDYVDDINCDNFACRP